MTDYATLAEFKAWKRVSSTDASDDTVIQQCLDMAVAYIESSTNRKFYTWSETRVFDLPVDRFELVLDEDLQSVTTLTNGDGTTIPGSAFVLLPTNLLPKFSIRLKRPSNYFFLPGQDANIYQIISVNGTWGYSATIPGDIKVAALNIAGNIYGRRFGEGQMSAQVTGAGVVLMPHDIDATTKSTIDGYVRLF